MLQYDEDIINVVDSAYRAGFYIPQYFFQKDLDKVKEKAMTDEVVHNDPMYFVKPKGIEFSYIIYWTGAKFRGGYVTINNNYTGVQRGGFDRNGQTLFASHVDDVRQYYKKFTELDKPKWIAHSFVLSDDNRIYYWGLDDVSHYADMIGAYTNNSLEDLVTMFDAGEKMEKPKGFISSLQIYDENFKKDYLHISEVKDSVSATWKNIYLMAGMLRKNFQFTLDMDAYIRKGYATLKKNKILI